MRSAATRRARYGTVTSPTKVASTSEVDARITVAQTLPASRETVEKSAEPKAKPRPTSASKNLTQTSAEADCSHWANRLGADEGVFNGLAYADATSLEPSILFGNGQSGSTCGESVRNLLEVASFSSAP